MTTSQHPSRGTLLLEKLFWLVQYSLTTFYGVKLQVDLKAD